MPRLRTVFMGSDAIALPLLDSIVYEHAESLEIVGVYTQPDRPHGRGMKLQENAIKQWARGRGFEVRQPEKLGLNDVAWLQAIRCELLLVMAYGHILRDRMLAVPTLPPLNFHASLLPGLRGASPIETAIATGEKETGVTLMKIIREMDAGPMLDREVVPIGPEDSRAAIHERLGRACVPLLRRAVPRVLQGDLEFVEQDPAQVTFTRIIDKDDSAMDFRASARELHDRCRAFQPWPGAAFDHEGTRIRVGATRVVEGASGAAPGTVLDRDPADGLAVQTGEGVLLITRLQRPGGRMLAAADFLRGYAIAPGTVLESRDMAPLVRPA